MVKRKSSKKKKHEKVAPDGGFWGRFLRAPQDVKYEQALQGFAEKCNFLFTSLGVKE